MVSGADCEHVMVWCQQESGVLGRILYILPVQLLTRALTECEPALDT